jgi:putative N6-adenine-specific DNA methylase
MINPPYGERLEVAGKSGPRSAGRAVSRSPGRAFPSGGGGTAASSTARGRERSEGETTAAPAAHPRDDSAPASDRDAPGDFFPRLATHLKHAYTGHPAGWTAWILSPDMNLPRAMRLKESRRVPMWNGPIECRLFRFDLVAGSARGPARAG